MEDRPLSIWTIYKRPSDYPEGYVARRFEVGGGGCAEPIATTDIVRGTSLDVIRGYMESQGLTCLSREPDDQPHVVEVWL